MSTKKTVGLVVMVMSILGVFYSITTYSSDTSKLFGYTYSAPYTTHEQTVIAVFVISLIALLVGICLLASKDKE